MVAVLHGPPTQLYEAWAKESGGAFLLQIGLNAAENGLPRPVRPPSLICPAHTGAGTRGTKMGLPAGISRTRPAPPAPTPSPGWRTRRESTNPTLPAQITLGNQGEMPQYVQNYHKNCHKTRRSPNKHRKTRLGSPRAPRHPHGPLVKAWRSGQTSLRGYGDVQGAHFTSILFFMDREVGDAGVASGGAISYFGVNSLRCSSYLASRIGRVIFKHQAW